MTGPLPGWLAPVTWPLAKLYGIAITRRNKRYDAGRGVESVDVPVVSVGNISVGGTGKTPMVAWISRRLADRSVQPVIAMRGYRAGAQGADEAREHAETLPGVAVLVDPDRVAAIRRYLPQHSGPGGVGCVVLDDGFQHRRLKRDLDIVLVDATRPLDDRLLPHGWQREPASSLRRADAVVVTRSDGPDEHLAATIERHHGRPPLAWTRHGWTGLRVYAGDAVSDEPVGWLDGVRLVTMLGVGNPEAVRRQAESAGAVIAADVPARDHEEYDRPKLVQAMCLCDGMDALLMTPKDWVKARDLIDLGSWPTPIVVPKLEIEIVAGLDALDDALQQAVPCRS